MIESLPLGLGPSDNRTRLSHKTVSPRLINPRQFSLVGSFRSCIPAKFLRGGSCQMNDGGLATRLLLIQCIVHQ